MSHLSPLEFALWLNGAAGLLGDEPPSAEQWVKIREQLGDVIAGVVAARLLEDAERIAKERDAAAAADAKRQQMFKSLQAAINQQNADFTAQLLGARASGTSAKASIFDEIRRAELLGALGTKS